jgi:hypothetical protein
MNNQELNIANIFLNEADETDAGVDYGAVKIFYSNLDLETRKKILDAIDESNEYLNVFTDEIVKNKIEEAFKNKPIVILRGEEIVNKMNIDF